MAASIDVIVPTYNNRELTERCLSHLAGQTVAHTVIVVDDGSSDGTAERLRRVRPDITILELPSNRGFTFAVNRGVSAGTGEFVVLVNNDVQLLPDCLERLVAPLESDGALGSVASLMLAPGGERIDSVGVTADRTLAGFARLQGRPVSEASASVPVLLGPEGTAGAYRRLAWEQVGGLDERIVAYMEVLDIGLRLWSAGWKSASAPDAAGFHLGGQTYGRRSARQRRLAAFSRGYLLRRYGALTRSSAARTLITEALVVAADAVLCRDLHALGGRIAGWRSGAGLPRHRWPPQEAIDGSISMRRSLSLRRGAVARS